MKSGVAVDFCCYDRSFCMFPRSILKPEANSLLGSCGPGNFMRIEGAEVALAPSTKETFGAGLVVWSLPVLTQP